MKTVSVLFDIPDGYELADEKARAPKKGERYAYEHEACIATYSWSSGQVPILRAEWKWPAWLKAPWIAMDDDGCWRAYLSEPVMGNTGWCQRISGLLTLHGPGESPYFNWEPPPVTDWKKSPRKNPNT